MSAATDAVRDRAPPGAPAAVSDPRILNALTVDVEDYFQVQAFAEIISRDDWDSLPRRVERNTDRLLDLFAESGTKATFFTLGWVAERHPRLVRRIVAEGHELASHGYSIAAPTARRRTNSAPTSSRPKRSSKMSAARRAGLSRRHLLDRPQELVGVYEVLAEAGYAYSSSIFPIAHDLYGMPDASRAPFREQRSGLAEMPLTTVRILGRNLPCSGGGYFRLLPYAVSRWAMRRVNRDGWHGVHLLSASVGDRSRAAAPRARAVEIALPPLHQSRRDRRAAAPAPARFSLGPHGPRLRRPHRRLTPIRAWSSFFF